jgi:hypothetical protein
VSERYDFATNGFTHCDIESGIAFHVFHRQQIVSSGANFGRRVHVFLFGVVAMLPGPPGFVDKPFVKPFHTVFL